MSLELQRKEFVSPAYMSLPSWLCVDAGQPCVEPVNEKATATELRAWRDMSAHWSLEECMWCTGTGCPRRLWMPHPCRHCDSGQPVLLVGDPARSRGLELMIAVVLFNPGHSMILWKYFCLDGIVSLCQCVCSTAVWHKPVVWHVWHCDLQNTLEFSCKLC